MLLHLSLDPYLHHLTPREPKHSIDGEPDTPRICVSPTINGCLNALCVPVGTGSAMGYGSGGLAVSAETNAYEELRNPDDRSGNAYGCRVEELDRYQRRYLDTDRETVYELDLRLARELAKVERLNLDHDVRTKTFWYVYAPTDPLDPATIREPVRVPDASWTGELWVTEEFPVIRLGCIAVIGYESVPIRVKVKLGSRKTMYYRVYHWLPLGRNYIAKTSRLVMDAYHRQEAEHTVEFRGNAVQIDPASNVAMSTEVKQQLQAIKAKALREMADQLGKEIGVIPQE